MDIISQLAMADSWNKYYEYKLAGGHLAPVHLQELADFIENNEYQELVEHMQQGGTFAPPRKACISKMHSEKKRIVYVYPDTENYILKVLTFLLQEKYDFLFANNLYSFRHHIGVKHAIRRITHTSQIHQMWSYKVDISNYFNSIPVEKMLTILHTTLTDEPRVYAFLESLLRNPLVEDNGVLIPEEKGIMAGTPISTFLANLYLSHMDHCFSDKRILYARYSDDIIIFTDTKDELEQHIAHLKQELAEAGLRINPKKEQITAPGEAWTFLGISYQNGVIDVSPVSVEKLKAKMRRKTRALMRWKQRKNTSGVNAAKAYVKIFNKKLFENSAEHELTWTRWYFPIINTAKSLQLIDSYSQSCIRYLATETRTKASYNFRYEDIKKLGYISLVNSYYSHRKEAEENSKDKK